MKAKMLIFLVLILIFDPLHAINTLSLKDAEDAKIVKVTIKGVAEDKGFPLVSIHYGKCIEFEVKNLSNTAQSFKVELGRKLICIYDSVQNMIVTRELIFTMNGLESAKYKAYAMCIEKHDRVPTPKSVFKFGDIATGSMIDLAWLIDKNDYQNMGGQNAVWVISDYGDSSNIYSSDLEEQKILRKYVSVLLSKEENEKKIIPENTEFIEKTEYNIAGNIKWDMKKKGEASLIVYDESGNYVTQIFTDRKFDEGEQQYDFKVVSCLLLPNKKYLVRLKINDLTEEELVLKAE